MKNTINFAGTHHSHPANEMHRKEVLQTLRLAVFLVAFLLASVFVATKPLSATSNPATSNSAQLPDIAERVDVRVVNVEAVVTDKHGIRIHDLEPGDFRLIVDGEEVPIDFFTEIRGGEAIASPGSGDIAPISREQQRGNSYLVFVDEMFTIGAHRNLVLDSLQRQLDYLGPNDRMAVVAWNGSRVEMLSSWTSNHRDLEKTFRLAQDRPSRGLQQVAERNTLAGGFYDPYYGRTGHALYRGFGRRGFGGVHGITERAYLDRYTLDLESVVDAAAASMRSFAFPPGRKVMLLVSGGWAFNPADYVVGNAFTSRLETGYLYPEGDELYRPLVDTANLLGYTLYPIDAPGLQSRGIGAERGYYENNLTSLDYYREDELHYTLRYLAHETGGTALLNSRRKYGLEAVADDTRSFYWLGFTPTRTEDNAERRIEVVVNKPRLEVRTRSGYTDLSHEVEVATAVESSMMFGHPIGKELSIELGPAERAGIGRMTVPLRVEIPVDQIALLPVSENGFAAELELRVGSINHRGERSDIPLTVLRLSKNDLAEAGETVVYETTLKLRRQPHDVVVAVYDPASGELFSSTASVAKVM